jgi:hypothetical protein
MTSSACARGAAPRRSARSSAAEIQANSRCSGSAPEAYFFCGAFGCYWATWRVVRPALRPWENFRMSIEKHLEELEKRHRALEAELVEALAHPSTDHVKIVELKRRKLLVKDEITRLCR